MMGVYACQCRASYYTTLFRVIWQLCSPQTAHILTLPMQASIDGSAPRESSQHAYRCVMHYISHHILTLPMQSSIDGLAPSESSQHAYRCVMHYISHHILTLPMQSSIDGSAPRESSKPACRCVMHYISHHIHAHHSGRQVAQGCGRLN